MLGNVNTFIEDSHYTRWPKFHLLSIKMKTCKSSCCQCVDRKEREDSGPAEVARATIVMLRPENSIVHSLIIHLECPTFWHHGLSLNNIEERVGYLVDMLHAHGVESGVTLISWIWWQGGIGDRALQDAAIGLARISSSSIGTAGHHEEERHCPHHAGKGEEDLGHFVLLASIRSLAKWRPQSISGSTNVTAHILGNVISGSLRVMRVPPRSPIEPHSLIFATKLPHFRPICNFYNIIDLFD